MFLLVSSNNVFYIKWKFNALQSLCDLDLQVISVRFFLAEKNNKFNNIHHSVCNEDIHSQVFKLS